jgi:hypothetical protein
LQAQPFFSNCTAFYYLKIFKITEKLQRNRGKLEELPPPISLKKVP